MTVLSKTEREVLFAAQPTSNGFILLSKITMGTPSADNQSTVTTGVGNNPRIIPTDRIAPLSQQSKQLVRFRRPIGI